MINFFSTWVKNISLALIVVSILEMLLPNNKTKKYVKVIMGLYILFSMISPFIENSDAINLNEIDFNTYLEKETIDTSTEVNQESMDIRLDQIYKEKLEKDIENKLLERGYELTSCKVTAHISENDTGIEKITIKVKEKIIKIENDEDRNINVENKIVDEIQEIKKVEIGDDKYEENQTNITKTDIKIIKDFLIKEYGVDEKCLKIS